MVGLGEYAAELIEFGQETRTLDYKGPARWSEKDKRACCEITKDILAMANTAGGAIVIGVSEENHRFVQRGLDPADTATWETTRLNNFINRYADPPINCRLIVEKYNGREFVIVSIPSFDFTPHITVRDYPDTINRATLYVRTANNASAPIENSVDFNALVERAIKIRRGEMLEAIVVILPELVEAMKHRHQVPGDDQTQSRLMRRAGRSAPVLAGAQLLWIDDNPEGNIHERRILRSLGVFVDVARSSEIAESLLSETNYDIVISDIARGSHSEEGLRFFQINLSNTRSPDTIFYIENIDKSRGTPLGSFALTNRPDELLHYIIDALERVRG